MHGRVLQRRNLLVSLNFLASRSATNGICPQTFLARRNSYLFSFGTFARLTRRSLGFRGLGFRVCSTNDPVQAFVDDLRYAKEPGTLP